MQHRPMLHGREQQFLHLEHALPVLHAPVQLELPVNLAPRVRSWLLTPQGGCMALAETSSEAAASALHRTLRAAMRVIAVSSSSCTPRCVHEEHARACPGMHHSPGNDHVAPRQPPSGAAPDLCPGWGLHHLGALRFCGAGGMTWVGNCGPLPLRHPCADAHTHGAGGRLRRSSRCADVCSCGHCVSCLS
jgi:hypothetical protein